MMLNVKRSDEVNGTRCKQRIEDYHRQGNGNKWQRAVKERNSFFWQEVDKRSQNKECNAFVVSGLLKLMSPSVFQNSKARAVCQIQQSANHENDRPCHPKQRVFLLYNSINHILSDGCALEGPWQGSWEEWIPVGGTPLLSVTLKQTIGDTSRILVGYEWFQILVSHTINRPKVSFALHLFCSMQKIAIQMHRKCGFEMEKNCVVLKQPWLRVFPSFSRTTSFHQTHPD